jgi:hypothetical protein
VLFTLPHLEDFSDRPFIDEFSDAFVFGREAQLLGIHEFAVGGFHRGDHFVRFLERETERFLDDHVFARFGCRHNGAVVKHIGKADVHDVAAGLGDYLLEVSEGFRDAVLLRKCLGAIVSTRVDRNDFGFGDEPVV